MKLDTLLCLSKSQVVAGSGSSSNTVDLSSDRNIGIGEPMAVVIFVEVAADFTTGDETYNFRVETDDNDSFSSVTLLNQLTVLTPRLQVGDKVVIPFGHENERYIRVVHSLAGTTPSITLSTYIMPMSDIDGAAILPNGYDIT